MLLFRALLVVIFTVIVSYTVVVVANHGLTLFPVFFGDIAKMGWPGQFNLDFMGFLLLSGIWMAWRHHFSPIGLMFGLFGFFGGAPMLTAYVFFASLNARGDMKEVFLGKIRAQQG